MPRQTRPYDYVDALLKYRHINLRFRSTYNEFGAFKLRMQLVCRLHTSVCVTIDFHRVSRLGDILIILQQTAPFSPRPCHFHWKPTSSKSKLHFWNFHVIDREFASSTQSELRRNASTKVAAIFQFSDGNFSSELKILLKDLALSRKFWAGEALWLKSILFLSFVAHWEFFLHISNSLRFSRHYFPFNITSIQWLRCRRSCERRGATAVDTVTIYLRTSPCLSGLITS